VTHLECTPGLGQGKLWQFSFLGDWLSTNEPSRFSRKFKLEALRRMEAGESVSVLARELGVSRKGIYQWRSRYRLGGGNALRSHRGRMTKAEISAREEKPAAEKQPEKEMRQTSLKGAGPGATANCGASLKLGAGSRHSRSCRWRRTLQRRDWVAIRLE